MKEITCMCGWKTRGTQEEVITAIQDHAWTDHHVRVTREEAVARTFDVDR
jgi:predicted small metal-binding protein